MGGRSGTSRCPAIAYAQSDRAALLRYTEHGELSIDNNLAERMLCAQAIGRRQASAMRL